uniref:Uncharacterized protein n=1 Tax=Lepeophtheirus salmonis TaxID=72036 RepID=A0A0K2TIS1_LEPSM
MVEESMPSVQELKGVMYLDPSWFDIINIPDEKNKGLPIKSWISFKPFCQKGHHGFMSHLGKKYPPESTNTDEFQVQSYGPHHLTVTFNNTNEMRFVGTKDVFASIHHSNVTHMDISKGGIGVSLGKEGKKSVFRIWECSTGIIRRELDGHCGYGYSVRLFPSGIVIITSGGDMVLNIWSAETGKSHRTLKGHTAGVNDTAIVGIGKNVVSVSNDSTIRLWNCGSGLCLDVISKIDDVPIICEINDYIFNCNSHNLKERKEGEHDTENKLLVVGCEKGLIVGVNIFDRAVVFQNKIDSGIKDIKFNGENGILVGCENGSLHKYSLNSLNGEMSLQLERVWLDSESSIESLLVVSDGVFVGRRDGSCIWYSENHDVGIKRISLVGADADPIYSLAKDDQYIYTGARDGKIRKYLLSHIFKS